MGVRFSFIWWILNIWGFTFTSYTLHILEFTFVAFHKLHIAWWRSWGSPTESKIQMAPDVSKRGRTNIIKNTRNIFGIRYVTICITCWYIKNTRNIFGTRYVSIYKYLLIQSYLNSSSPMKPSPSASIVLNIAVMNWQCYWGYCCFIKKLLPQLHSKNSKNYVFCYDSFTAT